MPEPATAQLVELCLTHQFWRHKSSFPHGPTVEGSEEELRRMLTYFHIEMETCPNHSVSPFLEGQPARLIGALNWCKEQSESSEVLNWTIAELTSVIYIHACLTSFGELGVLMDRRQPPFEDDSGPGRPRLSKVIPYCMMHLLVLGGDAPYMEMIRDVTVGHYIAPQPWQDLMKQLVASRNKINIIAALILGANVSFLTIQGLQEAQSTISMMSALLSLASLVVGIQQERLHERLLKTTAVRGSAYFYRAWISRLGYRGVALTYALPTALLSWAIITLVAPILLWTFQNIAGDWIARSIIIGLIVVLLAVVACSSHFINHLTTSPAGDQPRKKRCMMSTAADYVSDRACTGAKWVGYGAHVCWRVSGHRGYKWIRTGIRCLVRRVCGSEEELPQPATAPNARAGP
ncbi:hypothetical protein CALVIDRAFT_535369 [Calocera viscosa TUFC12733]|uniref:Uncharacterized protein n=1 Tax=Calocera viscosa (strain TUFC12733) TaxID=1330018 RepID=A0A167P078_CALVF|nr:hypothetical protein CALVIDRAFT_535369 [Calocera viscosa TUFC12733]